MDRRDLLAGASLAAVGLAGCLRSDDGRTDDEDDATELDDDERTGSDETAESERTDGEDDVVEYDGCGNRTVWISNLPEPARNEAMTALEDGAYETDGDLVLADVVDLQYSYLKRPGDGDRIYYDDRVYYGIEVEDAGRGTRLRLEETIPKAGLNARAAETVSITNELDADVTADLRLEYRETHDADETAVLVEETLDLEPEESVEFDDVDYRFGVYSAAVAVEGDGIDLFEEVEWNVDEVHTNATFTIATDRRTGDAFVYPSSDVADIPDCEWDDDGNRIAGDPLEELS